MHRYSKIFIAAFLLIAAFPIISFADDVATSTDAATTTVATTTDEIPQSFCDRIDTVTEAVHADASARAAEHRADIQRIDLQREDDKKKLSEVRTEDRVQEDAAREALIDYLRKQATTEQAFAAIDSFATNSARYLHDLRVESDKARDLYASVSRPASIGERAIRDKALTLYIEKLDTANALAEGECAKGANDEKVLDQYNTWLEDAKVTLAKTLNQKNSTLDQTARDAHLAELSRLEKDYQRKMQGEMKLLTDNFPELFAGMDDSATSTPDSTGAVLGAATGTTNSK